MAKELVFTRGYLSAKQYIAVGLVSISLFGLLYVISGASVSLYFFGIIILISPLLERLSARRIVRIICSDAALYVKQDDATLGFVKDLASVKSIQLKEPSVWFGWYLLEVSTSTDTYSWPISRHMSLCKERSTVDNVEALIST